MMPEFRRDFLGAMPDGFREYGDVVTYHFGPRHGPSAVSGDVVMAHHPDDIHKVLTSPQEFSRRTSAYEILRDLIGEGMLTSDGDVWKRQRRTVQPLFTPRRVAGYTELMADEAARIADEAAAGGESVVDLSELMQRYTVRVIGRAIFGDDIDEVIPELQKLAPVLGDLAMSRAMQLVKLPLNWPTPQSRRFTRMRAAQYAIVDRILARRAEVAGEERDDLISRLYAARDPETGLGLSAGEIRDQVFVLLLAGHETSASALTFTLHLLGRHPEVQDRIAAEGGRHDGEFVRAAIMEGMRLYPPAYNLERLAESDVTLSGYRLPAGTKVVLSPWVTHRHPDFWPEPERFRPDRFLGRQERPRYAYFPFGGGPRSCIGEHLAMLESTVLLSALLARFRVRALDERPRMTPMITLRPAGPVRAVLTAR
jgi:cytochrome P450